MKPTKSQIINYILEADEINSPLAAMAEIEFGLRAFDNNFSKLSENELQEWYKRAQTDLWADERDGYED